MRGYVLREKVVVHTKDGRSIDGVLTGVYRQVLVVAHAQLLLEEAPNSEGQPLEGDVVIERTNVSFVQRVP